ncbi:hypothetical protein FRC08_003116, partial [Ceratobasidium sp. 394]
MNANNAPTIAARPAPAATTCPPTPPVVNTPITKGEWRNDVAYQGGDVVTYKGRKWTAVHWNQASPPGGAA